MKTLRKKTGLGLLLLGMVLAFNGYAGDQQPGTHARSDVSGTGMAQMLGRAQQGDANAQNTVGAAYAAGNGVPKDETRAYRWFKRSAQQGHAAAQYNLYLLIRQSALFQDKTDDAMKWLTAAADQGLVRAQLRLAEAYRSGAGVAADDHEALVWFRRAAQENSAVAQYNLSKMFALGTGTDRSLVEAYAWSALAARQELAVAIKDQKTYYTLLNPAERIYARASAEQKANTITRHVQRHDQKNILSAPGITKPMSGLEGVRKR